MDGGKFRLEGRKAWSDGDGEGRMDRMGTRDAGEGRRGYEGWWW